jgi:hypothetical protein
MLQPLPKTPIKVGKVYARGELSSQGEAQWAFNLEVDGNVKGYAFATKTDAVKGRVLIRKKLQSDGFKIHS